MHTSLGQQQQQLVNDALTLLNSDIMALMQTERDRKCRNGKYKTNRQTRRKEFLIGRNNMVKRWSSLLVEDLFRFYKYWGTWH